jgi:DNA-binding XRE family transcriptional regulator
MNGPNEVGGKREGESAGKPPYADSSWRPGMDPNYSSHRGDYPWSDTQTSSRRLGPTMSGGDFAWIQAWHDEQAVQLKTELLHRLFVMPSGPRIRNLRAALGWTQEMAALRLGVSRRTVIRHEQAQHRRPWPRLELLFKLRELESDHAEELIAYLSRAGREHT